MKHSNDEPCNHPDRFIASASITSCPRVKLKRSRDDKMPRTGRAFVPDVYSGEGTFSSSARPAINYSLAHKRDCTMPGARRSVKFPLTEIPVKKPNASVKPVKKLSQYVIVMGNSVEAGPL